jgi:ketosteroid isomerase-like protein
MSQAELQAQMDKVNRKFEDMAVRGDMSEIGQIYSEDARILPPGGEMVTGLDHIRAFWEQALQTMSIKAVKLKTVEVQPLGEAAVEIGRAELETAQGTYPAVVKYVVVWKQERGAWKWSVDIWNGVG